MEEKNWLDLMQQMQVSEIRKTNEYSQQYGLILREEDMEVLLLERKNTLKEEQRVEFGESILKKLILEFCDSAYISQDNYVETLVALQGIFYHYKNEALDEITDDELLNFMKEQFETICYGDLDYLENTCLDLFSQAIRAGYGDFKKTEGKQVYAQFDEVQRWDKELYLETLKELCWR